MTYMAEATGVSLSGVEPFGVRTRLRVVTVPGHVVPEK